MKMPWYLGMCLTLVGTAAAVAPSAGFDRYQIILDRKPFSAAGGANAAATATVPAETFAKGLRMSALLDLPSGFRVGLIGTALTNQSFFLGVGEKSDDGIELVSVNYEAEEALLRKGTEEVVLKLTPTATNAAAIARAALSPPNQPSADPFAERRAYWERRRVERGSNDPGGWPPRPSAERLQQRLQEYQMRAIRSGMPALPVPLTPEMDAQLVREGVLPPQ